MVTHRSVHCFISILLLLLLWIKKTLWNHLGVFFFFFFFTVLAKYRIGICYRQTGKRGSSWVVWFNGRFFSLKCRFWILVKFRIRWKQHPVKIWVWLDVFLHLRDPFSGYAIRQIYEFSYILAKQNQIQRGSSITTTMTFNPLTIFSAKPSRKSSWGSDEHGKEWLQTWTWPL